MVNDLQNTLQRKNEAVNKLTSKSPSLKKVMQPRMAYKYAPREQSTTDLMAMNASSQYAFSGRKASNLNREEALNAYNRRAQSIGAGATADPAAAPSSGKGGNVMFNDTSATALEEQPEETAKSTKE